MPSVIDPQGRIDGEYTDPEAMWGTTLSPTPPSHHPYMSENTHA